jgi:hypothetical protein
MDIACQVNPEKDGNELFPTPFLGTATQASDNTS